MQPSKKSMIWAVLAITFAVPLSAQGSRATRPQVQRPDGPVWDVIRKNCIACHGIDDYAFYAQDRAAWQALIASKHKAGEAVISAADQSILLDWLVSKFGPETKPFPRTYIPAEITTFFSDPEARRLLNRACATCHGLERVEATRNPVDAWRVTLLDMRERGAKLSDQEVEQLTEWLGRVWGTNQDK
jgi:mono/diheme cytochrome c family protein